MQPYEGQMEGYPVALWGNVSCFQEAQSSSYDSCCVNGHLQLYHSSVSICRRSCEPISCRRPSLWHCCKDSQPLRTKSHSCLRGCTEARWLEFLRIFRLARGCIHCMGRFDMLPMASELFSRTSEGFEAQRPQCAAGQAVAAFSVLIASAVAFSLNSRLPVHAYAFEAQYCFRVSFGLGFKCLFHFAPVYGLVISGTVYGVSFVTISIPVQRIGWFDNESIAVGHMPWRPRQSYWHRLHHAACHRWIGGIFAESQMFRCSMCLHRWNRCHSFSLPLFAVIGLGRLSLFTYLFHFTTRKCFCFEFPEREPLVWIGKLASPLLSSRHVASLFERWAFTRWIALSLTWAPGVWVIASISWHGRCGFWLWMPGTAAVKRSKRSLGSYTTKR